MVYGKIFFFIILTLILFGCFLADVMPFGVNGRCYCQADVICLVGIMADVIAKR